MSEQTTGGAPAPAQQAAEDFFIGGFRPETPTPHDEPGTYPEVQSAEPTKPVAAPAAPAPVALAPAAPATTDLAQLSPTKPDVADGLAEIIREQREARVARAREADVVKARDARVQELETEVSRLKATRFEDDPVGYVKAHKLSPETQALLGKTLLYDLAPEKAPPDIRVRLLEAKIAREKNADAEAARTRESVAAERAAVASVQTYAEDLRVIAGTFAPGSYPESEVWFSKPDGSMDHDTYHRSLLAAATDLASRARAAGQVADLRPEAVARALEADIARRMTTRDTRRQKAEPKAVAQAAGGTQPAKEETVSTRGLNASGTRTPPSTSDAERVRRAAAVAFRTR